MQTREAFTVLAAAAVLVLADATAAHAAVSKTGYQSCRVGEWVQVVGKGSGELVVYWPSGTYRDEINFGDVVSSKTWNTKVRTTDWKVESIGGYLDDAGTYSWCMPYLSKPATQTSRLAAH